MAWGAVLTGTDASRAQAAVTVLADELAAMEIDDPSLLRGSTAAALVHAELARDGDERAATRTRDLLEQAIDAFDGAAQPLPWFGTGICGLAWAMDQLRDIVEVDGDVHAELDDVVTELVTGETWTHPYWLWEGIVGLGVYALSRGLDDAVHGVVHQLDRLAHRSERGLGWWNREHVERPSDADDPRGYHNLGIAVGAAGATAFLAEAAAAGVSSAAGLLDGAVRFLLSYERPATRPRFPMCDGLNVPIPRVRNSWCYGDAAIAAVVVRAGRVADRPDWLARGHAIARAFADDAGDGPAGADATLCCGTAGRAHLLARLGHALRDPHLLAAARRYYLATLDLVEHAPPRSPALNGGASGIALALHTATCAREPRWDRALLVALPPAA